MSWQTRNILPHLKNIDCDGSALVRAPWGWATPTTQWCDLPLGDFDDLDAFLEAYLEAPPHPVSGVWWTVHTCR